MTRTVHPQNIIQSLPALLGTLLLPLFICGAAILWNQAHPYRWGQVQVLNVAQKAVADYLAGNFSEAEAGFRAATFMEPNRMALWYNLGNACFKTGNYGEALKAFQKARSLDPKDPDVLHNLQLAEQMIFEEKNQIPGQSPSPLTGSQVKNPPGSVWQEWPSWFHWN